MHGSAGSSSRGSHGEDAAAGDQAGRAGRGVAPGGRDHSRALFWICVLAAALVAGCAARRTASAPAPAPPSPVPTPGQVATPARPGTTPVPTTADAFPPLPGTNRVYPSQDARNQVVADAPEAFPLARSVPRAAAKGAAAGPAGGDSATVSAAEDRAAGSGAEDSVSGSVVEDAKADTLDEEVMAEPVAESPLAEESVAVSPSTPSGWSVQLLASSSLPVARERAAGLTRYFPEPPRVEPVGGLFKVRVGHCATRGEAERLRRKALKLGLRDAFVVAPGDDGESRR